ncbi:hypothetical protein DINM_001735 [Dirofilaria immitis]|nr:hypothetical protein [Dirofilaria immitis]
MESSCLGSRIPWTPLPKLKIKGRPDYPISNNAIRELQNKLKREYEEMEHEYIKNMVHLRNSEKKNFWKQNNVVCQENLKKIAGSGKVLKARANVGNLLHEHRTIENSLEELIIRQRWD